MNRPAILIVASLFICACSNSSKTTIKQVSWTGFSHSYADTIVSFDCKDTIFNFKYLYMAHHISFDENGEGILVTRKDYESTRQFYNIVVNDSLRKIVFDLVQDSSVINYKKPVYDPDKEARLYCGYNYLISITNNNHHQQKWINYIPPDANTKLYQLNAAFRTILNRPTIKGKTYVDTLTLDSVILEKAIYFNPLPPFKSTVKFTPPQ